MITSTTVMAFEVRRKQVGKGKKIRFEETLAERPFYYEDFHSLDTSLDVCHDVAMAMERINANVDEEEYSPRKVVMRIQVEMENGG